MGTGPVGSVFGENSYYRVTQGTRRRGRHVAKCSSEPWVAYPEVKVQVRDLVRVVGIVVPFAPRVSVLGAIRFIAPQGVNGHRRPVPGAHSSGMPRESQAKIRERAVWSCRRVLWLPGPRGQYSGKIRFIEKSWVQDEGVATWLNVVLTRG